MYMFFGARIMQVNVNWVNGITMELGKDISYFDPSRKNSINVLDFWERLLVDSIKYLKWHDLSELPLNQYPLKRKPSNNVEREKIYKNITETSLGVYHLKDYFREFISFERLLYGAEQFYRDHVFHLIRVWLIGQYILSKKISAQNGFGIEIGESGYTFTDYEKVYKNDPKTYKSRHIPNPRRTLTFYMLVKRMLFGA